MIDTCHICHSSDLSYNHKYFNFPIVRCNNCGFIRAKNTPSEIELKKYYSVYSYQTDSGIDIITKIRYTQLLEELNYLRKTNNILDFGCGFGHFLEIAGEHNWNAFGTEFSEKANEILTKKKIKTIRHENFSDFSNQFDIIICIEVIEHVTNPKEVLEQIYALLRPGGCVYFTTPNIKNLSLTYMKNKEYFISLPEHLNYFSVNSMRTFLKNKFSISSLKTTGIIPYGEKRTPSNATDCFRNLGQCKTIIEKRYTYKIIKSLANFFLNLIKRGDTIKVFAIKAS